MKSVIKNLLLLATLFGLVFMVGCSDDDEAVDPIPEPEVDDFSARFEGTWKIMSEAGAMGVGPAAGSIEWWGFPQDAVDARGCFLDDTYTFSTDGKFTIDTQGETWLEPWQGVDSETCGAPVAPHGGGEFEFAAADETTLRVVGSGAYIGLPKVGNEGELPNVNVPNSITYNVTEFDGTAGTMTLQIESGSGVHWQFKLKRN